MKKKFQAGFFLGRFSGKQHTILDQKIDDWKSDISVFLKPTTYKGCLTISDEKKSLPQPLSIPDDNCVITM